MRILYVDHAQLHSRSGTLGQLKAWQRIADVRFFDYRAAKAKLGSDRMNAALCTLAEDFQPDIVQIGKGESVRGETVNFVKESTGAVVLHCFDDLRFQVPGYVAAIGRYADWTLLGHKDPGIMEAHRSAGCQRIGYCPWGFDPEVYYPRGGARTLDAVFAGHLYVREMKVRLEMVKALVDAGIGVHTYGPLEYAGPMGFGWQTYADKWGFAAHPFADMDEMAAVYSQAKIAPALGNDRPYFYFGVRRAYECMGCGCFHLIRYTPGLEMMFDNRRHLVWWETLDEMVALARYYLGRDMEREAIAETGRRYVLANYTWDHAIQRLLRYAEDARR